jgi:hypothetical protein
MNCYERTPTMFASATNRGDMLIVITDHGKKKYRRSRATRSALKLHA